MQRVWRAVVRRLGEHRAVLVGSCPTGAAQRQLVGGLVEALRLSIGAVSAATEEVAATNSGACDRGVTNPRSRPSQPAHPSDAEAEAKAVERVAAEVLALLLVEHHRNVRPAARTVVTATTRSPTTHAARCVRRDGDRDSHYVWLAEVHAHARRSLLLSPVRAFMQASSSGGVTTRVRPPTAAVY